MKLSPAAELAIKGTMVLAEHYGGPPVTLSTVCSSRKLPHQYMAKIFASLAKAGIVTPVRGKHGGYTLARPPENVTALEVIEAIEGPLVLNLCQHNPPKCDDFLCALRPVWSELQDTVRRRLAGLTLADCVSVRAARTSG